jgi:molybdopterin biosynthesis enzyme MoaB
MRRFNQSIWYHTTEDRMILLTHNLNTCNVDGISIILLNVVGGTGIYNKRNVFCDLHSRVHSRSMKPWAARHVHLYSSSVHASASTAGVNVAAAACTLPGSSGKVVGNGGTQTVSSKFHQKKKSSGVRPRERNGQSTSVKASDPRRLARTARSKCGD